MGEHHHHHDDRHRIDTGDGVLELEIFEQDTPPCWRIRNRTGRRWPADAVTVATARPDGTRQVFGFADRGDWLESVAAIPEPHEFTAHLLLRRDSREQDFPVVFTEHAHGLAPAPGDAADAHDLAHAEDIRHHFAERTATTPQIVAFGLTGGLIPCPAAITVLLLCLQLRQFTLGVGLVLCFSIGLAITMVSAGVLAALGLRHVSRRWAGFGTFARRAPYFSGALIICVGLYTGWQGLLALAAAGAI